jgi:hypothetical protein
MSQPRGSSPDLQPRTAFLIDRFTDTSRVIYVTNDIILHTGRVSSHGDGADVQLTDQSFYSIVKPSDRALVKEYIDRAKSWSPVVHDERRSGGHSYVEFEVLRVSDIYRSPVDDRYPTCRHRVNSIHKGLTSRNGTCQDRASSWSKGYSRPARTA